MLDDVMRHFAICMRVCYYCYYHKLLLLLYINVTITLSVMSL